MDQTGIVEKITPRSGIGKNGQPYTLYSVTVSGAQYGCGFNAPSCAVGDTISFQTVPSGSYFNIVDGTMRIVAKGTGAPPTTAPAAPPAQGGGTFKGTNKEFRSVPELNRVDALKIAISNRNEPDAVINIVEDAILIESFIQDGSESTAVMKSLAEYVGAEGPVAYGDGLAQDDAPF